MIWNGLCGWHYRVACLIYITSPTPQDRQWLCRQFGFLRKRESDRVKHCLLLPSDCISFIKLGIREWPLSNQLLLLLQTSCSLLVVGNKPCLSLIGVCSFCWQLQIYSMTFKVVSLACKLRYTAASACDTRFSTTLLLSDLNDLVTKTLQIIH